MKPALLVYTTNSAGFFSCLVKSSVTVGKFRKIITLSSDHEYAKSHIDELRKKINNIYLQCT